MIKTAIIGFGLSGKVFHAPFIHSHDDFQLSAIVQRNDKSALAIYPYVNIVRDFKEILQDESIDLVIICTPNIFHFEMAQKCLEAGKHIVIEKPFMPTSAEADKIIELAHQKGLKIFVYQNRRWDGDFLTIRKLLKEGWLGDLEYFEAHFDRYSPERKRAAWRDEVLPGSGILFDLGSHLIDQVLCLFGKPLSISAQVENQRAGSKVDDYFKVTFRYQNLIATVTAGMLVQDAALRYKLNGSEGKFKKFGIDPQEDKLKSGHMPVGLQFGREEEQNWGEISFSKNDLNFEGKLKTEAGHYMSFYNNVHDVLTNNAEMAISPAEARDTIRAIELAFESSQNQKEIEF